MIDHIKDKFTIPVGLEVEIDADNSTIRMLESAVILPTLFMVISLLIVKFVRWADI
ncbi:hypothetical protein [Trichormus azollae]|uniref:hypothetical protein n=1 Tax=Trichormus azollae TaxID=1164 RepID=UPI003D32C30F